jgi:DNA-directed RNA polymerase specialized sigma subunit
MRIDKEIVKSYLYNIDGLKENIEELQTEISKLKNDYDSYLENNYPLKASQVDDMPKPQGKNKNSHVEMFVLKKINYMEELIVEEIQLRKLYLSIKIVLNQIKIKEKNIIEMKFNRNETEIFISKEHKVSSGTIQNIVKKTLDKILKEYNQKIKI